MVTEAQVHHACDAINARGQEPKYGILRDELGGHGSWSTIKRYRDTWLAREDDVPPVPEALHAHLVSVAAAVWRCAYPLASGTFGEERRGAVSEIAELTDALARTEDELATKKSMIAGLSETADDLRARLADAEAARRDEATRYATLSGEVGGLKALVAELKSLLGPRAESMPALRVVGGEASRDDRIG